MLRRSPPGVPAAQKQLWRASPPRRRTPVGVPAPQEQLCWASPPIRSSAGGCPHPAGTHWRASPTRRSCSGGLPLPAGANFPLVTKETKKRCRRNIHTLNFTREDAIKIKYYQVVGISRTYYLSIETISRPPQSRETVPLIAGGNSLKKIEHSPANQKTRINRYNYKKAQTTGNPLRDNAEMRGAVKSFQSECKHRVLHSHSKLYIFSILMSCNFRIKIAEYESLNL
jgi:hypothetical protein